ncbi:TIGR03088 family PEP-CTERM/XrtA system glycosyltransferase [Pseudomaricurvus alcaniphilus]|uniref:TIGR03088 family PEP-CTERM/XrtA system glycosyltransferase n=1 Tax=Pseudomaricurvus alcaniphilus TaxID=1166482 RepID=UPI00140BEBF9|nr:TIGR03088 family PEP-CTERM/XrtA system glycosyltransferase [Pseudomaricurvus alcaniphilus]NHN36704.1 TIGR03088 family PEP-CTERM/XrtA system glycosyltransferase [Pseudomaricurvus alcaniphilus]
MAVPKPIHVAHVVHALKAGGLENGLVNLINHMPAEAFRHTVICMTDYDDFAKRIRRPDVEIHCLHKQPGKDLGWYWRAGKLLRKIRPDIVHTRNLATIEAQWVAFLVGVKGRVHGEHGWDMYDLGGSNARYRTLRKLVKPFIHRFVALSGEIEDYLVNGVGVVPEKLYRICNGVDVSRFQPVDRSSRPEAGVVIGTIGRMQAVKDPLNLVEAYIQLRGMTEIPIRLHMIGDGPLHGDVVQRLEQAGVMADCWIPGHREDTPACFEAMDIFALPSRAEGISNTILEAMAAGLPVVATAVGGNAELVSAETAQLVAAGDSTALARGLQYFVEQGQARAGAGAQARQRCLEQFSLEAMVARYEALYRSLVA